MKLVPTLAAALAGALTSGAIAAAATLSSGSTGSALPAPSPAAAASAAPAASTTSAPVGAIVEPSSIVDPSSTTTEAPVSDLTVPTSEAAVAREAASSTAVAPPSSVPDPDGPASRREVREIAKEVVDEALSTTTTVIREEKLSPPNAPLVDSTPTVERKPGIMSGGVSCSDGSYDHFEQGVMICKD